MARTKEAIKKPARNKLKKKLVHHMRTPLGGPHTKTNTSGKRMTDFINKVKQSLNKMKDYVVDVEEKLSLIE